MELDNENEAIKFHSSFRNWNIDFNFTLANQVEIYFFNLEETKVDRRGDYFTSPTPC